ncbi:MAG: hypothetical protein ACOC8S_04475 [Bacteroidota bacterium]
MYWINLIIPGVILLPNLIFFWISPSGTSNEWDKDRSYFLTILEWVGRIGVVITPVFTSLQKDSVGEDMAIIVLILFLLIYYVSCFRFFAFEMDQYYLYAPLAGIPIPLAVSPVIYFLFASYPLHSWSLFVATIIFGTAHIINSLFTYRQIQRIWSDYNQQETEE